MSAPGREHPVTHRALRTAREDPHRAATGAAHQGVHFSHRRRPKPRSRSRSAVVLPLVDVKEAGRWKDTATLVRCYPQSDAAAVLAVLAAPQTLRESGA